MYVSRILSSKNSFFFLLSSLATPVRHRPSVAFSQIIVAYRLSITRASSSSIFSDAASSSRSHNPLSFLAYCCSPLLFWCPIWEKCFTMGNRVISLEVITHEMVDLKKIPNINPSGRELVSSFFSLSSLSLQNPRYEGEPVMSTKHITENFYIYPRETCCNSFTSVYPTIHPMRGLQYYTCGKLEWLLGHTNEAVQSFTKALDVLRITHGTSTPFMRDLLYKLEEAHTEAACSRQSCE